VESREVEEETQQVVKFASYNSFDEILPALESRRIGKGYTHVVSAFCKELKCSFMDIADGIWSITHPHCAAPVQVEIVFPSFSVKVGFSTIKLHL
jgi:hypothetical protein